MVEARYQEHPTFARWGSRAKDFFTWHLGNEEPMSGAIVQFLLEKSVAKRDLSFQRYAIKTCRLAPSSSKSCMTVAEFYMGEPNFDALSNAMGLALKCQEASNRSQEALNAFCDKGIERAKTLSLSQQNFSNIISLATSLTQRSPVDEEKTAPYLEKAALLFDEKMEQIEKTIVDCKKAKEEAPEAGALCYKSASAAEKIGAWVSWSKGESEAWKKEHALIQERALHAGLHNSLTGCVNFARACASVPGLRACSGYVDRIASLFRMHMAVLQEIVNECSGVDIKNTDSWNRCYAHANWREGGTGPGWKEVFVETKRRDLQKKERDSIVSRGPSLARACSNFPEAKSCQGFAEEIVHRLIQFDLPRDALKLLFSTRGALGPILENLAKQNAWKQGVDLISTYGKDHLEEKALPHIVSFSNQLMASDQAYRGFVLIPFNDELDIEKAIKAAFKNSEENHLHRVYLLAKSWIAKPDKKYEKPLKFIIESFFHFSRPLFKEMAKTLVTKWIESAKSESIEYSTLVRPPLLNQKPLSSYDRYSISVTKANWKHLLFSAGL